MYIFMMLSKILLGYIVIEMVIGRSICKYIKAFSCI